MSVLKNLREQALIGKIELLDWGYEMSDDPDTNSRNRQLKNEIEDELSMLAVDEVQQIISLLSPYGFSNWERYFKLIE